MSDDHKHTTLTGYIGVFVALMVLTILTYGAFKLQIQNPALNIAVAVGIAVVKSSLVMYFFMHLRESAKIIKTTAITGVVFLIVLLVFVLQDVLSRHLMEPVKPWPTTVQR